MKNLLLFLVLFITSFVSRGQTYNPTNFTVSNKAYGIAQAAPTDARSYFYDASLFIQRPYQSTAEVLSYLNLTKYRAGNFPIYISSGTLQSGGTFTGGTITEYWFKDGTANNNLVIKSTGGGNTDISGKVNYSDSIVKYTTPIQVATKYVSKLDNINGLNTLKLSSLSSSNIGFAPNGTNNSNSVNDYVIIIGTSITQGAGVSDTSLMYANIYAGMILAKPINLGIPGSRLIRNSVGDSSLQDRLYWIRNFNGCRGIVCEYGTNDANQGKTPAQMRAAMPGTIDTLVAHGFALQNITFAGPTLTKFSYDSAFFKIDTCMQNISKEKGINYASFYSAMRLNGDTLNVSTDNLHPFNRGHLLDAITLNNAWNNKKQADTSVVYSSQFVYGNHTVRGDIQGSKLTGQWFEYLRSQPLLPNLAQYQTWYNSAGNRRGTFGFTGQSSNNFQLTLDEGGEFQIDPITNFISFTKFQNAGLRANTGVMEIMNNAQSAYYSIKAARGQFTSMNITGVDTVQNIVLDGNLGGLRVLNLAQNGFVSVTATSFIKNGGLSTQYQMADGSVVDDATLLHTTGAETISGVKTFTNLVDIQSNVNGFLIPRMTTTERDNIAAPAEGLQVYNLTTHTLNFWNGTVWKAVVTD